MYYNLLLTIDGKNKYTFEPGSYYFQGGVGVGSLLSGFISGHNIWTLVSGGRYIRPYSRISSCLYLLLLMDICYYTMEFIYLSRV